MNNMKKKLTHVEHKRLTELRMDLLKNRIRKTVSKNNTKNKAQKKEIVKILSQNKKEK
jgi:hypothetical protein